VNLGLLSRKAFAAIFLGYVFGVAAFTQGFSRLHLQLGGIPVFVGEAVIGILAFLFIREAWRRRIPPFRFGGLAKALVAYLVIGAIFAVYGLVNGYGVAAIRDFALVYYLALFFFTLALVGIGVRPGTILDVLALGSVVGSIAVVGSFLSMPSLSAEHGATGYQSLVAWLGAIWLCLRLGERRRWTVRTVLVLGIALNLGTVYLAAYRTLLPIMLASVAILWIWTIAQHFQARAALVRGTRVVTAAVALFGCAIIAHNLTMAVPDGPVPVNGPVPLKDGLKVLSYRWVRGFRLLTPTIIETFGEAPDDAAIEGSLRFRILVWGNAMAKIKASPLLGIGFGPAPALYADTYCDLPYSPTSNCGNAHNTYLTIAMRMGIPMFLLFSAINLWVVVRFVRTSFTASPTESASLAPPFLAAAYASFLIYALMSLFLESPYLSSLYWMVLGLMYVAPPASARPRSEGIGAGGRPSHIGAPSGSADEYGAGVMAGTPRDAEGWAQDR
jgi:hypothetical protein